ncbi:MAG TPA: heavy metal-binding domain-containing protein [Polyangiaceae bacterium]|nr:heavy metal-binding domain-containing protein [Polyangiaceae bacterium]
MSRFSGIRRHAVSRRSLARYAVAVASFALACGPDLPATWPKESAASPVAEAAPAAPVTLALEGPPPLPGEASRWSGLGAAEDVAAHEHAGHAAHRYVCPMHPDVVADQPGKCPRCGMALVERDAPK